MNTYTNTTVYSFWYLLSNSFLHFQNIGFYIIPFKRVVRFVVLRGRCVITLLGVGKYMASTPFFYKDRIGTSLFLWYSFWKG